MSLTVNTAGGSKSQRIASQRKTLDEASRRRRARKGIVCNFNDVKVESFTSLQLIKVKFFTILIFLALESLEADNFHDDPHADLVMSKKALNLFQEVQHSPEKSSTTSSTSASQLGGITNSSSGTASKSSKRRLKTAEYYKQR